MRLLLRLSLARSNKLHDSHVHCPRRHEWAVLSAGSPRLPRGPARWESAPSPVLTLRRFNRGSACSSRRAWLRQPAKYRHQRGGWSAATLLFGFFSSPRAWAIGTDTSPFCVVWGRPQPAAMGLKTWRAGFLTRAPIPTCSGAAGVGGRAATPQEYDKVYAIAVPHGCTIAASV